MNISAVIVTALSGRDAKSRRASVVVYVLGMTSGRPSAPVHTCAWLFPTERSDLPASLHISLQGVSPLDNDAYRQRDVLTCAVRSPDFMKMLPSCITCSQMLLFFVELSVPDWDDLPLPDFLLSSQ